MNILEPKEANTHLQGHGICQLIESRMVKKNTSQRLHVGFFFGFKVLAMQKLKKYPRLAIDSSLDFS